MKILLIAFCACLCLAATSSLPTPAFAGGFVDDVWGVVTDPLKLGKASSELSDTVDRTLSGLRELETKTNKDVTDRIEKLRAIVTDVLDAVDKRSAELQQTVDRALRSAKEIEQQTYRDAIDLIYRAQCTVEVFTSDQLQRAISQSIESIRQSNPGITFLGIKFAGIGVKSITITDPDQAYISTKKYYLSKLKVLKDDDPAIGILSVYSNIARFARFTRCHYLDLGMGLLFIQEQKDFEMKASPWLKVVQPTL